MLKQNRYTDRLGEDGRLVRDPLAANVHVYSGALVVLDSAGYLAPGSTSADLRARGVARGEVNNTGGAAGDVEADVERGVFCFDNDGSVDRAHIEGTAYIVDDHTVASADDGGARSVAGRVIDVDDDGVWIAIGI